jgi:hypothetical protein
VAIVLWVLRPKEIFLIGGGGFDSAELVAGQPRISQQDAAPTAINWKNITVVLIAPLFIVTFSNIPVRYKLRDRRIYICCEKIVLPKSKICGSLLKKL